MTHYLAVVGDYEHEFNSTRKSEIKKLALEAIKDGKESVDVYANGSYQGSFYADGEMPRIFTK